MCKRSSLALHNLRLKRDEGAVTSPKPSSHGIMTSRFPISKIGDTCAMKLSLSQPSTLIFLYLMKSIGSLAWCHQCRRVKDLRRIRDPCSNSASSSGLTCLLLKVENLVQLA